MRMLIYVAVFIGLTACSKPCEMVILDPPDIIE